MHADWQEKSAQTTSKFQTVAHNFEIVLDSQRIEDLEGQHATAGIRPPVHLLGSLTGPPVWHKTWERTQGCLARVAVVLDGVLPGDDNIRW